MQFFLDYIQENQQLRSTLNRLSEDEKVQGLTIRFSDEFLWFLQLRRTVNPDILRRIFRDYFEGYIDPFYRLTRFGVSFYESMDEEMVAPFIGYNEFRRLAEEFKYMEMPGFKPILITICVFNDVDFRERLDYNLGDYGSANEIRFVTERRNPNIFYNSRDKHVPVVGGISIGKINDDQHFGTLGGMLEGNDGSTYGLTCGHVATTGDEVVQPSMAESGTNESIGHVIDSGPVKWSKHCDAHNGKKCYDISLIKIANRTHQERIHKLGPVRRYRNFSGLSSGMRVEFNGRTTNKRKTLYLGSLCISYKVGIDEGEEMKYACFNNLIELRSKPYKLFGMIFQPDGEPVLPGDSGAWVCSNDSKGYSWCGMIMSGDIDRGYFIAAEHVLKYLGSKGYNFTINSV
jgi:hypothetical protein